MSRTKYPIQLGVRASVLQRLEREVPEGTKVTDLRFIKEASRAYYAHFDLSIGGARAQRVELGPTLNLVDIEKRLIAFLTA